jgi:hypothetical protein
MKMTAPWLQLHIPPLPALLASDDPALEFFVRRDLLGEAAAPLENLWELPAALRILKKQQADGRWRYPGNTRSGLPGQNYDLLETFRQLGILVEQYGFTRDHPAIERAAAFVFSCQTEEGDIRGILSNQYMPYYHGMLLAQLIQAGYGNAPQVQRGLDWLLAMRQADGGWVAPLQGVHPRPTEIWAGTPVPPDPAWPSSHLATGMALRPFALLRLHTPGVRKAAGWLKGRFFKPDHYYDRQAPGYWVKFQYPFWWTNLLMALDSLARLGYSPEDMEIREGLAWFVENQEPDGLWPTGYGAGSKAEAARRWVGLAICRVVARFMNFS